jgi:hypothetical protein
MMPTTRCLGRGKLAQPTFGNREMRPSMGAARESLAI